MASEVVVRLAEAVTVLVGARRDLKDRVLRGTCSMSEAVLLHRLAGAGPQRVTQLAEVGGVDASVVSRQVASLVQQGLAERAPDPGDGRSHLVAVTAEGSAVLEQARRRLDESWATALAGWPPAELDALAAAMTRLGDDLTDGADRRGGTDRRSDPENDHTTGDVGPAHSAVGEPAVPARPSTEPESSVA